VNKSTDQNSTPPPDGLLAQEFLGKEFRLLDRYEMQRDLVEALQNTEHHTHLVPKVAACHKSFRHWRCERNHDWAEAENSCSVRVCPHCSHRRSKILAERTQSFLVGKAGLRYAVLAERNSDDLQAGISSLWESWTRLRRSVKWKRKVQGCIVALEVTYNREQKTWHPHLNVLMEGEYFPFEELNQAWIEATNHRGQTSFIRAADEGTVHELIKYVTKVSDLLDDASALDEFLTAAHGRRLIRTYGSFRGLSLADEESPETGGKCPDCGPGHNVSVVQLGYVHAHQLRFDFEKGVFRVARSPGAIARDLDDSLLFVPGWIDLCDSVERERIRRMHDAKRDRRWGQPLRQAVKEFAAQSRITSGN
jgi:DNA-directed RNA polymerase subunit RPC12/RpoP